MVQATKGTMSQANVPVISNEVFSPVGPHLRLTSLAAAVVIAPGDQGIADAADKVMLQADTQNVRITFSSESTPTATVGFLLQTTDEPRVFVIAKGAVIQAIQAAGGAILQVQFGT